MTATVVMTSAALSKKKQVKKVRIFRAWFTLGSGAVSRTFGEKAFTFEK